MTENRLFLRRVVIAWAIVALLVIAVTTPSIWVMHFPDPDDQLRLVQVRDWLGGQSWFDVTQYRIAAPQGVAMHWSRIVDLPIAAVIVAMRPLLGNAGAELTALIAVPMVTLLAVMLLTATVARRVLDAENALLATVLIAASSEVLHQLQPMRIDHHGWQIALALLVTLALTHGGSRRWGVVTGLAAAVWLAISLEGLTFVAGGFAVTALGWAWRRPVGAQFAPALLSFAIAAPLLLLATRGSAGFLTSPCDALSPAYLTIGAIGAAGALLTGFVSPRLLVVRLAVLAVIGVLAMAALMTVAPRCAAGPFATLDPLVRQVWYLRVGEGLPLWYQSLITAAATIVSPVVGLVGTVRALTNTSDETRERWGVILAMLATATLSAVFVQRYGSTANVLAMPGLVWMVEGLLHRARTIAPLLPRLGATTAAIVLMVPGLAVGSALVTVSDRTVDMAVRKADSCTDDAQISVLARVPRGTVLAPLDVSPSILLHTVHDVVATGHHRGSAGMHDVIAAFMGSAETAHAVVTARHVDYVAICPGIAEPIILSSLAPHGFMVQLERGRAPAWLTRVRLTGSPARVWRVLR